MAARTAPPQPPRPAINAARSWRHVGMPPYETRRWCGGNRGPARAAANRPYGAPSPWPVGRGAHTPPNRTAGINRPAIIATRRRSSRRGGFYIRPDRTAGTTMARNPCGPVMAACGHAALRGSAVVRWESRACSGGHKGRPYAVFSARFVGWGAHTPPDRARNHRNPPPVLT